MPATGPNLSAVTDNESPISANPPSTPSPAPTNPQFQANLGGIPQLPTDLQAFAGPPAVQPPTAAPAPGPVTMPSPSAPAPSSVTMPPAVSAPPPPSAPPIPAPAPTTATDNLTGSVPGQNNTPLQAASTPIPPPTPIAPLASLGPLDGQTESLMAPVIAQEERQQQMAVEQQHWTAEAGWQNRRQDIAEQRAQTYDDRQQAAAIQSQQKDARDAQNAAANEAAAETGQKFFIGPDGIKQPVLDPVTNKPVYAQKTGEVQEDPLTGRPTRQVQNSDGSTVTRTDYKQWDSEDNNAAQLAAAQAIKSSTDPIEKINAANYLRGKEVGQLSDQLDDLKEKVSNAPKLLTSNPDPAKPGEREQLQSQVKALSVPNPAPTATTGIFGGTIPPTDDAVSTYKQQEQERIEALTKVQSQLEDDDDNRALRQQFAQTRNKLAQSKTQSVGTFISRFNGGAVDLTGSPPGEDGALPPGQVAPDTNFAPQQAARDQQRQTVMNSIAGGLTGPDLDAANKTLADLDTADAAAKAQAGQQKTDAAQAAVPPVWSDDPEVAKRQKAAYADYMAAKPTIDFVNDVQQQAQEGLNILADPKNDVNYQAPPVDGVVTQQAPRTWGGYVGNIVRNLAGGWTGAMGSLVENAGNLASLPSRAADAVGDAIAKPFVSPETFNRVTGMQDSANNAIYNVGKWMKNLASTNGQGGVEYKDDKVANLVGGLAGMGPMLVTAVAAPELELATWASVGFQDRYDAAIKEGVDPTKAFAQGIVNAVIYTALPKVVGRASDMAESALRGGKAADVTTTPFLNFLQKSTGEQAASVLTNAAKAVAKGEITGWGFGLGGEVASGQNPADPETAAKNTGDVLESGHVMAGYDLLFGALTGGRTLNQVAKAVDEAVKNAKTPTTAADVVGRMVFQNQMAQATASFDKINADPKMTAQQKEAAKTQALTFLTPSQQENIKAQMDLRNTSSAAIDAIETGSAAAKQAAGARDKTLNHLSDDGITSEISDVSDRLAQKAKQDAADAPKIVAGPDGRPIADPDALPATPRPVGSDPTLRHGPQATPDYLAQLKAEQKLRQTHASIEQAKQDAMVPILQDHQAAAAATQKLAATPGGVATLAEVNRYNSTLPVDQKVDARAFLSLPELHALSDPGLNDPQQVAATLTRRGMAATAEDVAKAQTLSGHSSTFPEHLDTVEAQRETQKEISAAHAAGDTASELKLRQHVVNLEKNRQTGIIERHAKNIRASKEIDGLWKASQDADAAKEAQKNNPDKKVAKDAADAAEEAKHKAQSAIGLAKIGNGRSGMELSKEERQAVGLKLDDSGQNPRSTPESPLDTQNLGHVPILTMEGARELAKYAPETAKLFYEKPEDAKATANRRANAAAQQGAEKQDEKTAGEDAGEKPAGGVWTGHSEQTQADGITPLHTVSVPASEVPSGSHGEAGPKLAALIHKASKGTATLNRGTVEEPVPEKKPEEKKAEPAKEEKKGAQPPPLPKPDKNATNKEAVDKVVAVATKALNIWNQARRHLGANVLRVVNHTESRSGVGSAITPNGEITIGIDPKLALERANLRASKLGGSAEKWLQDAVDEEIKHVADKLVSREAWEAEGRKDKFGSPINFVDFHHARRKENLAGVRREIEAGNLTVARAFVESGHLYADAGKGATDEEFARKTGDTSDEHVIATAKALLDHLEKNGLETSHMDEFVRQLLQAKHEGTLTEVGFRAVTGKILKWMKAVYENLQSAVHGSPELQHILKPIEDLLYLIDHPEAQIFKPETPAERAEREKAEGGAVKEAKQGGTLLKTVMALKGITPKDAKLQGEIDRVRGAHKAAGVRYFRAGALPLDKLREALAEKNFVFDSPHAMLNAIEEAIRTGKDPVAQGPGAGGFGTNAADIAPAEYAGEQETVRGSFPIYRLQKPVAHHPEGSTVSGDTLRKMGYQLPPRALGEPNEALRTNAAEPKDETGQTQQKKVLIDYDQETDSRPAAELEAGARSGSPEAIAGLLRRHFQSDKDKLGNFLSRDEQTRAYLDIAESLKKLLPETFLEGDRKITTQGEHDVFEHNGRIYKATQDHADFDFGTGLEQDYQTTPYQYLNRFALSNRLFGGDIKWEGVIYKDGHLRTVTSQSYYDGGHPSEKEITAKLSDMGFQYHEIPSRFYGGEPTRLWYRPEDGILLGDTKSANFIQTPTGAIRPIDVIAEKATEAQKAKYGLNLTQTKAGHDLKTNAANIDDRDLFGEPIESNKPAKEPLPPGKEGALATYKKLKAIEAANGKLTPGQGRMLEVAEKALGQKFLFTNAADVDYGDTKWSPGYEAAREYLLARRYGTFSDKLFSEAGNWLKSVGDYGEALANRVWNSAMAKGLLKMEAAATDFVAKLGTGSEDQRDKKLQIQNFLQHRPLTTQKAERFLDDLFAPSHTALPSETRARVRDGRIVRTIPAEEADRTARLIARGRQLGQNRFSFVALDGRMAQIYTAPDGATSVRLPSTLGLHKFSTVSEAVGHLVDQGFDLQSSTLDRKLARAEAVANILRLLSAGAKLGQNRFNFQHEDGRTAALIMRKDGAVSVAGLSDLKRFGNVQSATNFLHDQGFGLQSSILEKNLWAKGLHPDQADEPIPYTQKQIDTINQYRRARGESILSTNAADAKDESEGGPDATEPNIDSRNTVRYLAGDEQPAPAIQSNSALDARPPTGDGGSAPEPGSDQGAATPSAPVGEEGTPDRVSSARAHLEAFVGRFPSESHEYIRGVLQPVHDELANLPTADLKRTISIQRPVTYLKGKDVADFAKGHVMVVTEGNPGYAFQQVADALYPKILNATQITAFEIDDPDFELTAPIIDPFNDVEPKLENLSPEQEELISHSVVNVTDKYQETVHSNKLPRAKKLTDLGVKPGELIQAHHLDALDKEFGKDEWVVKPYYTPIARQGAGIYFPEVLRPALNGERVNYNRGYAHDDYRPEPVAPEQVQSDIRPDWFMAQERLHIAGEDAQARKEGRSILPGEFRVHVWCDMDGGVHVIPHATWAKGAGKDDRALAFSTTQSLEAERAMKEAVEALPLEDRRGSFFGGDALHLKKGGYAPGELNPNISSEHLEEAGKHPDDKGLGSSGSVSGYVDYFQTTAAILGAIRGELPFHAQFAREQMKLLAGLPENTDLNDIGDNAPKPTESNFKAPAKQTEMDLGHLQNPGELNLTSNAADFEDDATHLKNLVNELNQGMPASRKIDQTIKAARAETPGEQTIGRPEFANYAPDQKTRRGIDALQELYHDKKARQTQKQWSDEAETRVLRDPEGEAARILQKSLDPETHGLMTPTDVKVAQLLSAKLMRESYTQGNADKRKTAQALVWANMNLRSENARAQAAMYDPFKNPTERAVDFLTKMLSAPGADDRAHIRAGKTPEEREQRRQASQDEHYAKLTKALAAMGVKPEDIYNGNAVTRIKASGLVNSAVEGFGSPEHQKAARMALDGYSKEQIEKATGVKASEVQNLRPALEAKLRADLAKYVARGFDTEAQFEDLAAQGNLNTFAGDIPDDLRKSKLTPEQQAALVEKLLRRIMPDPKAADSGKLQKRLKRRATPAPAPYEGNGPSNNPIPPYEPMKQDEMKPGLTPEEQAEFNRTRRPSLDPVTAQRYKQAQDMYDKEIPYEHVPFNPENPIQVLQLARAMQASQGNKFDMVYEAWVNSILSGPQTHVALSLGMAANAAWDMSVQRGMEALTNAAFFRDPNSAQFGEFKHMLKAVFPSIARGLRLASRVYSTEEHYAFERSVLNHQMDLPAFSGTDMTGGAPPAIPGKIGRVIRIPSRVVMFQDTFFKQVIGQMEAAAQAYRLGKAQGHTGQALEDYIHGQVSYPGSEAWQRAVARAEEGTFQTALRSGEEGGGVGERFARVIQDMRHGENEGWQGKLGAKIAAFIFPFIRTPYNLTRTGLAHTPLGGVAVGARILNGLFAVKDGKPFLENYSKEARQTPTGTEYVDNSKPQLVRDISMQTLAWTTAALLYGMVEGDKNDDQKQILITGSRPHGVDKQGSRDLANRVSGGPYQIRIGGRNGTYFNYGRTEPFAGTIGTVADAIRVMKQGRNLVDSLDKFKDYFLAQVQDKTFLQGITSIADAAQTASSGEPNAAAIIGRQIVTGLVPNLIRQPLRNLDDYERDSSRAGTAYAATALGGLAEKKSNLYGEPELKAGTPLSRIFFRSGYVPTPEIQRGDQLLTNWNRQNPDQPYYPQRDFNYSFKDSKGNKVPMTPAQIAQFDQKSGQLFASQLKGWLTPQQAANPTEETVKQFKETLSNARQQTKAAMFGAGFAAGRATQPTGTDISTLMGWR